MGLIPKQKVKASVGYDISKEATYVGKVKRKSPSTPFSMYSRSIHSKKQHTYPPTHLNTYKQAQESSYSRNKLNNIKTEIWCKIKKGTHRNNIKELKKINKETKKQLR